MSDYRLPPIRENALLPEGAILLIGRVDELRRRVHVVARTPDGRIVAGWVDQYSPLGDQAVEDLGKYLGLDIDPDEDPDLGDPDLDPRES